MDSFNFCEGVHRWKNISWNCQCDSQWSINYTTGSRKFWNEYRAMHNICVIQQCVEHFICLDNRAPQMFQCFCCEIPYWHVLLSCDVQIIGILNMFRSIILLLYQRGRLLNECWRTIYHVTWTYFNLACTPFVIYAIHCIWR